MKESRRHRWVRIGNYPVGDTRDQSVCRDCGLETSTLRVKHGGFGPCPGKMIEQQRGLSLISGDPQSLESEWTAGGLLACAGCGKSPHVMIAHRNLEGEITGSIFSCGQCFPLLVDHEVIIRPREKGESHGEERQGEGGKDGAGTSGRPAGEEGETASDSGEV